MSPRRVRVAVAVSGQGRSLRNLCEQQEGKHYEIAGVIASHPQCGAVDYSRDRALPLFTADFSSLYHVELGATLLGWLQTNAIDMIALAGFLKPFPCLEAYKSRMINIHPALLPRFGGKGMYGMHVHRAVHAGGETISGATVHFVSESYDEGAIIAQIRVPLASSDDAEAIARKVFAAESRLYPEVLDGLCSGRLPLPGGHVYLLQET